jgi:hypothetical protein
MKKLSRDPGKVLKEMGYGEGCKVVAAGGKFDGSEAMILGRMWAATNGGPSKGSPIWAKVEEGQVFAWLGLRPTVEGSAPADAWAHGLDAKTGKEGARMFVPTVLPGEVDEDGNEIELQTLKFKPDARAMGLDYTIVCAQIEAWIGAGDSHRRDLVFIAQLTGEAHNERNSKGFLTKNRVQGVSALVVIEVPSPTRKGEATLNTLGMATVEVIKPRRNAAKVASELSAAGDRYPVNTTPTAAGNAAADEL